MRFFFHLASALIILVSNSSFAQTSALKLFFEKVYVHTDRELYLQGEDIWYKAYLINPQTGLLTNSSNTLYVELINAQDSLISQKIIRLEEGLGHGDFKLDSPTVGKYVLRAYTNWMRNFGKAFVFEKHIEIITQVKPINLPVISKRKRSKSSPTDALPLNPQPTTPLADKQMLSFYPEGGSLVCGLPSRIAYKINSQQSNLELKATLRGSDGTEFELLKKYQKMGLFILSPNPNVHYWVDGSINNKQFKSELPIPQSKGLVMNVEDKESAFVLRILTSLPDSIKHLMLKIRKSGILIYSQSLLVDSLNAPISLSKRGLAPGVYSISLYDDLNRPWSERLLYVPQEKINVEISRIGNLSDDELQLRIAVKDTNGYLLNTNMSLSVTDADVLQDNVTDIRAYMLLQSELKGKIESPELYFQDNAVESRERINLLLMTQGWRDFLWKRLLDSVIKISYLPEKGISITGRVENGNKPVSNMYVSLNAFRAKGQRLFGASVGQSGHFYFDDVQLFGRQPITVFVTDNKGNASGRLKLSYPNEEQSLLGPIDKFDIEYPITDADAFSTQRKTSQKLIYKQRASYKLSDTIKLREITIKAKRQVVPLKWAGAFRSFGYQDENFKIYKADTTYANLQHYLLTNSMYTIVADPDGLVSFGGDKGKALDPYMFINGVEVVPPQSNDSSDVSMIRLAIYGPIYTLPMSAFSSVEVKKGVINGNIAYLLMLYTKPNVVTVNNSGSYVFPFKNRVETTWDGYYEARVFANEMGLDEIRSSKVTSFWESDVQTNEGKPFETKKFNSFGARQLRIKLEGISQKGLFISKSFLVDIAK